MKTAGYDNLEIARDLLNIIDWVLETQQIENRNNETTYTPFFDLTHATAASINSDKKKKKRKK